MNKKQMITYKILVEGNCEEWYFKRLAELINNRDDINYNVCFDIKKIKDNFDSYLKKTNLPTLNNKIYFIYDHEGNENAFKSNVLDLIKKCYKVKVGIKLFLGYTNLSFDLWILLHKKYFNRKVTSVDDYLCYINKSFDENFESMNKYKQEKNFKRCLGKISLDDIKTSIERSKKIMDDIKLNGNKVKEYKTFTYYNENPSISVHEFVDIILNNCGIK